MGGVHPRVLEVPRDEREWGRAHINTHEPKALSHPAMGKVPPANGRRSPKGEEARSQHYRKSLGRFWAPSWKPLAQPCRDLPTPVAISPLQGSESVRSLRESQLLGRRS